jgi:formylglycine-generating enzyme required for sulfatase activity
MDFPPLITGAVTIPIVVYAANSPLVSATIIDENTISSAYLSWGLVSGNLTNTIPMNLEWGNNWITSSAIPAQSAGTVVYYSVIATDDSNQTATSNETNYTVAADATFLPGDLVITEIMQNPNAVLDSAGEWFEVYNSTADAIDLNGLEFRDDGTNTFTVAGSVVVPAGGFAVLGLNGDTGTNGGVTLDYVYPSTWSLSNSDDEVVILDGATEIDRVAYDGGVVWPDPAGASMYLTDLAGDNGLGSYWNTSSTVFGAGDFGTPGEVNSSSQFVLFYDDFNSSGLLPPGWTIQSQSSTLTIPWAPVLDSGEDWAIQTAQPAFSVPQVEWLVSPLYNLAGHQEIELGYTHSYTHANSTATVKYSTNGGVAWQDLTAFGSTTSGNIVTDISAWADNASTVRFAFVFTGQFVVGGASWRIDDFFLDGVATAPIATVPVPSQPPAAWNTVTGTVGCTWTHPLGVSGAELEVRIDANGDGDYQDGAAENWLALADVSDANLLVVTAEVGYLNPGLHQTFEFRARSGVGSWAYSGTTGTEGIADDWFVDIIQPDTTPPTASTLFAGVSTTSSVTLLFSPTVEDHFARYEIRCSTDSLVNESDLLWTDTDDPALAEIGTYQTTITGLAAGTAWYFRLWAVDQAGNRSPASNRVRKVTEGSQVSPVTDLQATVQGNSIHLSWTAPTTNIYGQTPVAIEHYEIHASVDPFFTPNDGTRIGTTAGLSYTVSNPGGDVRSCFKVVVVGAGPGMPELPVPMIQVPAGSFLMGQVGLAEPEHFVTLTNDFWLGTTEVTNQQFLEALNWAKAQGLVTAEGSYIRQYGRNLARLSLSGSDPYELRFNSSTQQFYLQPSSNGSYNPQNYPISSVSWYGAACYCDWLSLMAGLPPYYNGNWDEVPIPNSPYSALGYRLPTAAEREYAASYSDDRVYPWGSTNPNCNLANFSGCVNHTAPVGTHVAGSSLLGLQDMAGNVWEWCNDWSHQYTAEPQTNPIGNPTGENRCLRGGGWNYISNSLQSAYPAASEPAIAWNYYGFRLCWGP